MRSAAITQLHFVDQPSKNADTTRSSFLDHVRVVELSIEEVEVLAAHEGICSAYQEILTQLQTHTRPETRVVA